MGLAPVFCCWRTEGLSARDGDRLNLHSAFRELRPIQVTPIHRLDLTCSRQARRSSGGRSDRAGTKRT